MEESLDIEDEEEESMSEDTQTGETLLDITVVPFEPVTPGSGHGIGEKQNRLAKAISDKIDPAKLTELKKKRASRLVTLTVLFYLWKGSPNVPDTRPVKDIDNLLKILLDVLGSGPQGLGVLESDSFISELYASKQLVGSKDEEGYRIVVEEYKDEEMLRALKPRSTNKEPRTVKP